jgi:hypothetical protein
MTFDRRRSELEARSLRRLDLPRVYHENQIAELDAHNFKNEQFSPKSPAPAARPRRLAPFGAEPAVSQPEPVWTNTAGKITTETNNKTRKDRQIEK